jgi:hypothetical protein
MEHEGTFSMFLSVAVATPKTSGQSHSTLDIYNTGECVSATGVATSNDLEHWQWQGIVLRPEASGWDCYCRRINSVIWIKDKFLAFYDGSSSHKENYEERTGLAVSTDLKTWTVTTSQEPALVSPHASHSLRYIDAQPIGDHVALFYEYSREDQAHDLRLRMVAGSALLDMAARS